jgi:2-methylcitrate dehydratase PrpD
VLLSGQRLQPSGAALANATMANALDIDDGHRLTKGHPGAVVFPAVLAAAEDCQATGEQFLISLLVAYEVAIRAGVLVHQLRPEYHCTGSWGALGAAAGVARILGLTAEQTEHALGIAEYHSTYSPMMRCIDHPSMLKDGIGWGSMAGISSAYLAREGFTGIPSLFSFAEAEEFVSELGHVHRIEHLYFKPYACCRWAQPAVEGVKQLVAENGISHRLVEKIVIRTFTESARLMKGVPANTEEAQYNLYFPIAACLVFGEVGPRQVLQELDSETVHSVMRKIVTETDPRLSAEFPRKALCQVEIFTSDGRAFVSPVMQAKGDYDHPLTTAEKKDKFFWLTEPIIGKARSALLLERIENVEQLATISELTGAIPVGET